MMTLNPLSNLFAQLEAQAKAVDSTTEPPQPTTTHPKLYLLVLDNAQTIQHFSPSSVEEVHTHARLKHGVSLLRVVAVPNAKRFLTNEELSKALAGTWRPMQNRTGLPPHTLLVRVANLLGCSGDYLLKQGFLEPCDLEEQAATDPWVLAEGIRRDPRWCPPPMSEQRTMPHEPDSAGQGEPQAHTTHWTAQIAPAEWLQARDAYLNHLLACPNCWAPIKRYCPEGQALHQHYQNQPKEARHD
ncbi:hypothetical protein LX59_02341 [Azomonas agilis]|uniref:Uncharacterized protein n=1 Tax=Azomonas agilis TaxID=116849 RepID=A0A562I0Z7_9GAMM|nr:hypothetical protein [Azomonas agilis]TWH64394.1 hypothetical protein LX59_02341 [Azomonas agilis]